jgi:RNA polymerase-interacting CarD/CdnL/TRCF family regulator
MSASEPKNGLTKGDWLYHPYHGVGQIVKVEKKELAGQESKYYRVETGDSTFWIPVSHAEESRVRPVVSRSRFRKALRLLRKAPQEMAPNYRTRKSRIENVKSEGSLREIVRMVRDLAGKRRESSLNTTEQQAYRHFKQSLIDEWTVVEGLTRDEAKSELRKMLRRSRKEASEEAAAMGPLGEVHAEGS